MLAGALPAHPKVTHAEVLLACIELDSP